ncbi:MAG: hypothetical protein ACT4OF_15505 [Caulobacteraceae bacterium]
MGIVSLVELCQLAMPDPGRLRARLEEAGFVAGSADKAAEAGRMLNLETGVVASRVRNLKHEIYGFERQGHPVIIALSVGDSKEGKLVFCSAIFRECLEADVVKAVAHVAKKKPLTGAPARTSDGVSTRRVFWDVEGVAGVRGLMITGPVDVEATEAPRAITAFNKAGAAS